MSSSLTLWGWYQSGGCPCPLCMASVPNAHRIPSSGKEIVLCSWTLFVAGAPGLAGACPGRLLPPVSVSPPLGQRLSPDPLDSPRNVEDFPQKC